MRARRSRAPASGASAAVDASALPSPTPWLVGWFTRYSRRYVARSFHRVRAGGAQRLPRGDAPLVIYCNHPSWWDPLTCTLLATTYLAERDHWALIAADQLERYRFFAYLGFVGIEPGTARGARRLLEIAHALDTRANATLWLTPEGRFADPRERPHVLAGGLARLARHVPRACFVPLALEYPFGEERLPEARALFGEPLCPQATGGGDRDDLGVRLTQRLTETADRLAALTIDRDGATVDPDDSLETILAGGSGVGGVYDLWRRARAALHGERFDRTHGTGHQRAKRS